MTSPNLKKIVLDYLLGRTALTDIVGAAGVYWRYIPDSILAPKQLVLAKRTGGSDEDDRVDMNRADHPRGIDVEVSCYGSSEADADSLFRVLDAELNGLVNVTQGTNTIRLVRRISDTQDFEDPRLPAVDGKSWWFVLATYDWEIF